MLLQIISQGLTFEDVSSIALITIGLVIYLYYLLKHSGRNPIKGTTRRIGKHSAKKKIKHKATKKKTTTQKTTKRNIKKPRRKTK